MAAAWAPQVRPQSTRAAINHSTVGARAAMTNSTATPATERMITGRRPKRSDSMPSAGAAMNWARAQAASRTPTQRAAAGRSPWVSCSQSLGRIGKVIDWEITSRQTVMAMKIRPARRARNDRVRRDMGGLEVPARRPA